MTKIEEVARAIFDELDAQGYAYDYSGRYTQVSVDDIFNLTKVAIAAVRAMRVPSEGMALAGVIGDSELEAQSFAQMIDAALAEHGV